MSLFVPLGVSSYEGKQEKGKIKFTIDIEDNNADKLLIQVRNGSNVIYQEEFNEGEMLKMGSHTWYWDGFDEAGILDTKMLTESTNLNLLSKVWLDDETEFETVDFKAEYSEVNWLDIRIDKKAKRIDVILRVNLTDGGGEGLDDWDEIPKKEIRNNIQPLKKRTQSFSDLEKLALEGLNYHWGRNKNHYIAKNVDINEEKYEIYVNAINTTENAMDDVELIYNTNRSWMRSGNPGTVDDPISLVGNIVSREAICFNTGYIKFSDRWGFQNDSKEALEFADTSAHEIGHTILKAYGGTFYSYGHKGSVNTVLQSQKRNAPKFPIEGEIDIMPYHNDNELGKWYNQPNYFKRRVASSFDVLSLIWLVKLELK